MTFLAKTIKNATFQLKLIPIGVLIGVVGGLLGTAFHIGVDYVTELRENNTYLIYFLPLGGIAIAFIYGIFKTKGNIDTKRVFQSVREDKDIPLVMIPLIFVGTVITHMLGGSAGREGAALQLGGSMGYNVAKTLKWDKDRTRLMVTAGMSSVFSALFGVPLAATVFSLEVTKKGRFNYGGLFVGLVSSVSAFVVSKFFGVAPVRFDMPIIPEYKVEIILKAALLALLSAGVCIIFATAIHKTELLMKKCLSNSYIRAIVGGLLIVVLTVALGTTDYNGAGMNVINNAVLGEAKKSAFILKIIFTAITVAAGFKGGEIVPTFFIGATFGCFASGLMGFDAGFGASLGFVAMFAGMTKCPVASLLLGVEVFGAKGIPLFAIAIVITYIFSGRFGLYENPNKKDVCKSENEEKIYLNK